MSQVYSQLSSTEVGLTAFPAVTVINTYVILSTILFYELLLFSFALWAAIQHSRCPESVGARYLRVILIAGNAMYFLVWV